MKTASDSPTLHFSGTDNSLRNHFLLAMPSLKDPLFGQTLTYICEHSENGAMGLIINHPLTLTIGDVFEQMEIPTNDETAAQQVLCGGPVQMERGFVLHTNDSQWDSTMEISEELSLTASKDILEAIAQNKGPEKYLFILGYAGWEAGQLEQELEENSWITLPADSSLIFDIPIELRWQLASQQLGVDLNLIAPTSGHA